MSNKKNRENNQDENNEKLDIKTLIKNNWIIVCAIVLIILIIIISLISSNSNKIGNSIGNIRNYGYVASENNWIYYLSPDKDGKKVGIYRIKSNGTKKQQLSMGDMDILSINAYDDYLYFIGIGKAYDEETGELINEDDEVDNKIYRMKANGKSEMEIINDNEFHNDCYEIYVYKNKIYYIGTDQNIWTMDLDGSNKSLMFENGTGYLGMNEKYIIYNGEQKIKTSNESNDESNNNLTNEANLTNTTNTENQNNVTNEVNNEAENSDNTDEESNYETTYVTYIMGIDGKNPRPIIKDERIYSVNIKGNYIYYTNADKKICRTKIDSNEEEILLDTTAYNLNLYENYLYFFNYENPESEEDSKVCIYRTRIDIKATEAEKVKELDTYSAFLNIVNNNIIYMDAINEESAYINAYNINNKKEIKLYELDYDALNEEDSNLEGDAIESEDVVTDETAGYSEEGPEDVEEEITENVIESAENEVVTESDANPQAQ